MERTADTPSTLVFDADCGICQKSVELLGRVGARVEFVPWYVWLVDHRERRRAHPVDGAAGRARRPCGRGRAHGGRRTLLLSRRPATWLGALIEVPGLHLFAKHAYRLVAANRARISAALGLDACAIGSRPT